MLATIANRRVAMLVVLLLVWGSMVASLGGLAGTSVDAVLITNFFGDARALGATAVWTDGSRLYLTIPAFVPIAICSIWPGHALYAISAYCFAAALAALMRFSRGETDSESVKRRGA